MTFVGIKLAQNAPLPSIVQLRNLLNSSQVNATDYLSLFSMPEKRNEERNFPSSTVTPTQHAKQERKLRYTAVASMR